MSNSILMADAACPTPLYCPCAQGGTATLPQSIDKAVADLLIKMKR